MTIPNLFSIKNATYSPLWYQNCCCIFVETTKTTIMKVLTNQQVTDKCELVYIETASGFHIALDVTFIEQVGDFEIILPTGEIISTKDLEI